MQTNVNQSVLELVQGDIVSQDVDAIGDAPISRCSVVGEVDGAIHRAAGPETGSKGMPGAGWRPYRSRPKSQVGTG